MANPGGLVVGAIVLSFVYGGIVELSEVILRKSLHLYKPVVKQRFLRWLGYWLGVMTAILGLLLLVQAGTLGNKILWTLIAVLTICIGLTLGVVARIGSKEVEAIKIFQAARRLHNKGKLTDAVSMYNRITVDYPDTDVCEQAADALRDLRE